MIFALYDHFIESVLLQHEYSFMIDTYALCNRNSLTCRQTNSDTYFEREEVAFCVLKQEKLPLYGKSHYLLELNICIWIINYRWVRAILL